MKTLKFLVIILFIGLIAVSCKKEEGPAGPKGPAGTNGTDGTDGNANVSVYGFSSVTFTSALDYHYFDIPITSGMIDSSFFAGYFDASGGWYEIGQIGPVGAYQSRYWLYDYATYCAYGVRIHNVDGSLYSGADVTWDSVRIFVIPANIFRRAEADKVDLSDYKQVDCYFSKN